MQRSSPNTENLETVIEKYADMLYRICLIMLKNESDAEDVVQDTFLRYYQKATMFQSSEHEKAWLIRVATNRSRDLLRFRARHPQVESTEAAGIAQELSDGAILEALAAVPEKYRLVLTLYYIEEYRIEDIAKIIHRTTSAVKMRLQKGRKILEDIYRKEYL